MMAALAVFSACSDDLTNGTSLNGSGQKLGILSRQSKGAEKSAPFFVDIAQMNSESIIRICPSRDNQ